MNYFSARLVPIVEAAGILTEEASHWRGDCAAVERRRLWQGASSVRKQQWLIRPWNVGSFDMVERKEYRDPYSVSRWWCQPTSVTGPFSCWSCSVSGRWRVRWCWCKRIRTCRTWWAGKCNNKIQSITVKQELLSCSWHRLKSDSDVRFHFVFSVFSYSFMLSEVQVDTWRHQNFCRLPWFARWFLCSGARRSLTSFLGHALRICENLICLFDQGCLCKMHQTMFAFCDVRG